MRKETWSVDLFDFIKSRKNTPFKWGSHDCTLFAADCVKVMTDRDPAKGYRNYRSKNGAALIVGKQGGLRNFVTFIMGSEILPTMAQRGDIVLLKQNDDLAIGICLGNVISATSKLGLVSVPMSEAITAWRVE